MYLITTNSFKEVNPGARWSLGRLIHHHSALRHQWTDACCTLQESSSPFYPLLFAVEILLSLLALSRMSVLR